LHQPRKGGGRSQGKVLQFAEGEEGRGKFGEKAPHPNLAAKRGKVTSYFFFFKGKKKGERSLWRSLFLSTTSEGQEKIFWISLAKGERGKINAWVRGGGRRDCLLRRRPWKRKTLLQTLVGGKGKGGGIVTEAGLVTSTLIYSAGKERQRRALEGKKLI